MEMISTRSNKSMPGVNRISYYRSDLILSSTSVTGPKPISLPLLLLQEPLSASKPFTLFLEKHESIGFSSSFFLCVSLNEWQLRYSGFISAFYVSCCCQKFISVWSILLCSTELEQMDSLHQSGSSSANAALTSRIDLSSSPFEAAALSQTILQPPATSALRKTVAKMAKQLLYRYTLPDLLLKEVLRRLVSRIVGVLRPQRSQVQAPDYQQCNWTKHLS